MSRRAVALRFISTLRHPHRWECGVVLSENQGFCATGIAHLGAADHVPVGLAIASCAPAGARAGHRSASEEDTWTVTRQGRVALCAARRESRCLATPAS